MMGTLEEDGWTLDDAVERHRLAPNTFQIPPEDIRANLPIGADAKLIFLLRSDEGSVKGERMWVRVVGRMGEGYIGVLNNDPTTQGAALALGDRLVFRPENIIDVLPPDASG